MSDTFRMYRKPGPPGEYYGYIELNGVTYKLDAHSCPDVRPGHKDRMYVGTLRRHLKADQQSLPLTNEQHSRIANKLSEAPAAPFLDFNDPLPEKL